MCNGASHGGYTDEDIKQDALKLGGCFFLLFVKVPIGLCCLSALFWILRQAFPFIFGEEGFLNKLENLSFEGRMLAYAVGIIICILAWWVLDKLEKMFVDKKE